MSRDDLSGSSGNFVEFSPLPAGPPKKNQKRYCTFSAQYSLGSNAPDAEEEHLRASVSRLERKDQIYLFIQIKLNFNLVSNLLKML